MSALARLVRRLLPARAAATRPGPLALTPAMEDYLLTQADALEFFPCPAEQQTRRPHAVAADGGRHCWSCGHDTPGDV